MLCLPLPGQPDAAAQRRLLPRRDSESCGRCRWESRLRKCKCTFSTLPLSSLQLVRIRGEIDTTPSPFLQAHLGIRPTRLDALWKERPGSQAGGSGAMAGGSGEGGGGGGSRRGGPSYADVAADGSDQSHLPVWLRTHSGFRPAGPPRLGSSASASALHSQGSGEGGGSRSGLRSAASSTGGGGEAEPVAPKLSRARVHRAARTPGGGALSRGMARSATTPSVGWAPVTTVLGTEAVPAGLSRAAAAPVLSRSMTQANLLHATTQEGATHARSRSPPHVPPDAAASLAASLSMSSRTMLHSIGSRPGGLSTTAQRLRALTGAAAAVAAADAAVAAMRVDAAASPEGSGGGDVDALRGSMGGRRRSSGASSAVGREGARAAVTSSGEEAYALGDRGGVSDGGEGLDSGSRSSPTRDRGDDHRAVIRFASQLSGLRSPSQGARAPTSRTEALASALGRPSPGLSAAEALALGNASRSRSELLYARALHRQAAQASLQSSPAAGSSAALPPLRPWNAVPAQPPGVRGDAEPVTAPTAGARGPSAAEVRAAAAADRHERALAVTAEMVQRERGQQQRKRRVKEGAERLLHELDALAATFGAGYATEGRRAP